MRSPTTSGHAANRHATTRNAAARHARSARTSALFALAMALMFTCMLAFAQVTFTNPAFADEGQVTGQVVSPDAAALDPDDISQTGTEALEAYIDRAFEQQAAPVMRKAALAVKTKAVSARPKAREQLSDFGKAVYDAVSPNFEKVAKGELTSTTFNIPFDTLVEAGVLKEKYTAEDLGFSTILNDAGTDVTQAAKDALGEIVWRERASINHAFVQDFVYELYWYDKTAGLGAGYDGFKWYKDTSDGTYISLAGYNLVYYFAVTTDCAKTEDKGTYETKDLSSIPAAAENAKQVVDDNKTKNDIRKLDAYRSYICNATDYDDVAVETPGYYGDPWQLVRVFDGNDTTSVVCEGYSKAFKRLCELSTFNNKSLSCYVTAGIFRSSNGGGEAHMWNTVSINGYNYLVDITNCDSYGFEGGKKAKGSGMSGAKLLETGKLEPGTGLFMCGSDTVATAADDEVVAANKDDQGNALYKDGYKVEIPEQKAGTYTMSATTMSYYYEIAASNVLPAESFELASWDCPLDTAADTALGVESDIAAIGAVESDGVTSDVKAAVASARAAYDALSEPQQSLVSNVDALEAAEAVVAAVVAEEAAAEASAVVKDLQWGETAKQGDGGTFAIAPGRTGEAAWICTDSEYDAFEIAVYRSDGTLVGTASADFSGGAVAAAAEAAGGSAGETDVDASDAPARTAYSYYVPQANFTLDAGTYYFTVQPKVGAGAGGAGGAGGSGSDSEAVVGADSASPGEAVDTGKLPKSGTWTYAPKSAKLAAPSGVALSGTTVSWTQPASAEPNTESLDKFTYWVFRSPNELTAVELARATFNERGVPQATHNGEDAKFELVIGADYPTSIADGDSAKTCTVDLAKFIRTFASKEIIEVKEGYYYTAVRAVSDDIETCQSSTFSALTPGVDGAVLVTS